MFGCILLSQYAEATGNPTAQAIGWPFGRTVRTYDIVTTHPGNDLSHNLNIQFKKKSNIVHVKVEYGAISEGQAVCYSQSYVS